MDAPNNNPRFAVGERVLLVDHPGWESRRELIGRCATILGLPSATNAHRFDASDAHLKLLATRFYLLDVDGYGRFGVSEPGLRKIDGDETPNKVVSWDTVPWKPREVIHV